MERLFLLIVLVLITTGASWGEPLRLTDDLSITVEMPESRWETSTKPSPALIEETAEHIHHDLEAQGKEVPLERVLEAAAKRLSANELFLRSDSGAHIEIDVSPLEDGEKEPSGRTLKKSAEFAAQSLESEEGVSDVVSRVTKYEVAGASTTYRLEVDFLHHGQKMKFVGIIGFVDPYWLYIYGTARDEMPSDVEEMEAIIHSVSFLKDM